uniref:receptor protein serine/threonine kinase n=1 Tax=Trichobilharzia regenti TaxID=157069 RepID=A0AA85JV87_TRIRE|nr:unnamed protein product [Trichobilharzia regenti]
MNTSFEKQQLVSCYCSPLDGCPHSSSVCVSSTGCFHSLHLDSSLTFVNRESYGCFANHTNQVDLHCRNSKVGTQLLYCCSANDGDLCNKNSSLLELLGSTHVNSSGITWRLILTAVLIPLSALFCGLLGIMLLWKCFLKKRIMKYERYSDELGYKHATFTKDISNYLVQFSEQHFPDPKSSSCITPSNKEKKLTFKSVTNPKPSCEFTSCTSGSGSGIPFLVQRTIARHIRLVVCIGKGRFGEVWKATCQGETVAVKIFSSRDEASWARETEVYNTGLLRHPNLLAYYASDMISRGGCTQLWLITAYHANGSLHDFLANKSLRLQEGLRLAGSIAAGLAFLHTEIKGLHAKPAIAHRDLKSKNVLVMHDMTACIADLGLALVNLQSLPAGQISNSSSILSGGVMSSSVTQSDRLCSGFSGPSSLGPPPVGPRVGTKRYMAPELLMAVDISTSTNCVDHTLCMSSENVDNQNQCNYLPFEVYQAADIYAMALVFWELGRCTKGAVGESIEGYQIPFYDLVPSDPTFAQMRDIVCGNTLTTNDTLKQSDESSEKGHTEKENKLTKISPDYDERQCRPRVYQRWMDDAYLCRYAQVIQECWHDDWSARLSALRVRKRLEQIEAAVRQLFVKKKVEDHHIHSNLNDLSSLVANNEKALL